jgi:hypothetical protein
MDASSGPGYRREAVTRQHRVRAPQPLAAAPGFIPQTGERRKVELHCTCAKGCGVDSTTEIQECLIHKLSEYCFECDDTSRCASAEMCYAGQALGARRKE